MKLGGQKIRGNERPPTDKLDLTLTRYYNKFTPIAVWKKVARKHIEREDQGGKICHFLLFQANKKRKKIVRLVNPCPRC